MNFTIVEAVGQVISKTLLFTSMPLDDMQMNHITILDTRWKLLMTLRYDQLVYLRCKSKIKSNDCTYHLN